MSSTTIFKRIALTAVAALGLGLVSAIPSQAVIAASSVSITASNGTATRNDLSTQAGKSDSTSAGSVTVSFQRTSTDDSVIITAVAKARPSGAGAANLMFQFSDTSTSTVVDTITMNKAAATEGGSFGIGGVAGYPTGAPAETGTSVQISGKSTNYTTAAASGTSVAKFFVFMDSTVANRIPGTYTWTVTVTPYGAGSYTNVNGEVSSAKSVDVSIVVSGATTAASSAYSTAYLNTGTAYSTANDSVVSVVATSSTTTRAVIRVTLKSSTGTTTGVAESVTVVTNIGNTGVSAGTPVGKNVTYAYTAGSPLDILVFSDGTAGTATITISTTNTSFTKTMTFYSTTATKLTVVTASTQAAVGSNASLTGSYGLIWVKATDANGQTVVANADGDSGVWVYSSDRTIISDSGTACAYESAIGYHTCKVTGVLAGSATLTIANYGSGLVNATLKGDKTVAMTVGSSTPATLKLAFNKASYAPGEKGFIYINALDASGKPVNPGTITNLMATGGISLAGSFSGTLPTLTDVTYTLKPQVAALDSGCSSTDAVACLVFYAPYAGEKMTITATGGSALPAAGQVAVSASAAVADNGAAALAAVTALASQVSAFITKINAQITTLTDLVMKIQKKVKA
jgi:hypothetical protein